jgi:hypothetical protein
MRCQNIKERISLEWTMGLNDNASTLVSNTEIVIPMTIAPDHSKTQPDAGSCTTSTK